MSQLFKGKVGENLTGFEPWVTKGESQDGNPQNATRGCCVEYFPE